MLENWEFGFWEATWLIFLNELLDLLILSTVGRV